MQDQLRGANSLYFDVRQGLPVFGYSTDTNRLFAQTSRPGGKAKYTKIDFSYSRVQGLTHSWSLYGLIKGQYSFQPLLAAEQFAYGGSQLGRGYDIAELLGDKALGGTVELRYDWAISKAYLSSMQLYGFYDMGKIWNYFSAPGIPLNSSAFSTGGGIRFTFTKNINGNLMIAKPLTKPVAAEAFICARCCCGACTCCPDSVFDAAKAMCMSFDHEVLSSTHIPTEAAPPRQQMR